jgi:hypothetical protein
MKTRMLILSGLMALSLSAPALKVFAADDSVVVPKTRLEELERKERELDRLKGDVNKTQEENARLKQQADEARAKAAAQTAVAPAPLRSSPPLVTLPPLKEGEIVDAMDLANYYTADPAAADQRFLKRKFILRGEISGFEKPVFKRNYNVLLKAGGSDLRVVCSFYPAEDYEGVFSADHGAELVATKGANRTVLAKTRQQVIMNAECQGRHGTVVFLSAANLRPAPSEASSH